MISDDAIITQGAAYFSAKAAELGLRRLALNTPMIGDVMFGGMKLRLCEDGGLKVFFTAPAEVKFEIGGDCVSIVPRV